MIDESITQVHTHTLPPHTHTPHTHTPHTHSAHTYSYTPTPPPHTHTSQGHLLLPGAYSSWCESIPSVNVNLTLIAFVNIYSDCLSNLEDNIYKAGYSAMLVYTLSSNVVLPRNTDLPQAMFSDHVSASSDHTNPLMYCTCPIHRNLQFT